MVRIVVLRVEVVRAAEAGAEADTAGITYGQPAVCAITIVEEGLTARPVVKVASRALMRIEDLMREKTAMLTE